MEIRLKDLVFRVKSAEWDADYTPYPFEFPDVGYPSFEDAIAAGSLADEYVVTWEDIKNRVERDIRHDQKPE